MLNQSNRDNKASVGPAGSLAIWARWLCTVLAVLMGLQGSVVQAQTVYYHNDASGSPLAASDAAGNLLWRESYRPYGERMLKPAAANSQWFHGKRADPDTGLQDFGARNYDPVLGRFLSTDPVDFQDKNIHSFNRYAYGNNNPLKFRDPDGRLPILIPIAIYVFGNAAIGAGFDYAFQRMMAQPVNWTQVAMSGTVAAILGGEAGAAAGTSATLVRASTAAKEAGVVANGIRGRASEARVLQELGLAKNTKAVSTAEGRSIPDALTNSLSVEVKDAANMSLTRQLRIQTEAARASGRESVLITGENTCVSGACSRAFDTVIRRPDLGPR